MGDDQEWKKLPTLDKIEHKNWKARCEGYEEALKEMRTADDGKSPVFNQYLYVLKKMVIDSNAAAQEKALEVVEVFCTEANIANKAATDVCPGIVSKCLNAVRPKTKEKAVEVMKLLIEAEKQDVVVDELIKGLGQKAPKTITGCILVLKEALHEFGPKIVPIKELFKHIPKLLEDRDKAIRESGKDLIVEIFRWVGKPAIEPVLSQLKPVQVTELTAEFDNATGGKPIPSRYLKSQKPKIAPTVVTNTANNESTSNVEAVLEPDIDPYDLIDPVEVVKKIPADFFDKIWTDRRDALEAIDKLTNFPKLLPGDYGDLLKTLLKVISKDTNVVLVALGVKILCQLAIGLRKKFSPYALESLKQCFEKFKEKKANVVKPLRDSVDASFAATNMDVCIEDIQAALGHKTPSVRCEVSLFINRIFEAPRQDPIPKKHVKALATGLAKLSLDTAPEVRDAAFQTLGTMMKVVGEDKLKPFLDGIDSVKMARIMEFFEKAKITETSGPSKTAPPPASTAASTKVASAKPADKPVAPERKGAPARSGAPTKKAAPPKNVKENAAKSGPTIPTEPLISDDDAIMKAGDLFGDSFVNQLTDKNYKERLVAMDVIQKFVTNKEPTEIPCQLVVKLLTLKPGFKDNNNQVLKGKIELVKEVVMKGKLTLTAAELCIGDLTEKIGDVKNSVAVKSTLTEMSDVLSLMVVAEQVIKTAQDTINVKNLIEVLVWLKDVLTDFGFKIPLDKMLPFVHTCLQHTSPHVRQAAIKLVGMISLYVRDAIGTMFKDEKASVKQLIDQEVEAMREVKPQAPTRGLRHAAPAGGDTGEPDSPTKAKTVAAPVEVDPDEFITRDNVSGKISETLLGQLAEKSWKVKKEAFEEVSKVLGCHPGVSADGLQPLVTAVAKNATDSSAVISKLALAMLTALVKQLSKKDAERLVRLVAPGLMAACSDAKPKNREETLNTLSAWTDKVGFAPLTEGGMLADAMKVDSPYQKAAVLTWMTPYLRPFGTDRALRKTLCSEFGTEMMAPFFGCLEERSPEVRKAAQEALLPLMTVLGFEQMNKFHNANTKLASKDNIKQFLEKARDQLPAKPSATAKSATTQATKDDTKESAQKKPKADTTAAATKTKKNEGKASVVAAPSQAEPAGVAVLHKASNRTQRNDDKKKRLIRWEENEANKQLLETQFQPNCSPELMALLFHKDFVQRTKAIEMLSSFLSASDPDSIEATCHNLDLILKWMIFRLNETNPSVINKGLDYMNKVFSLLTSTDNSFMLHEQEAMALLPELITKLGDSKNTVRDPTRKLLFTILKCYPANKMSQFLEASLESKTARVRQECADFLRGMISNRSLDVFSQQNLLKSVAQRVAERDNTVRTAALDCLVAAYDIMGEDLLTTVLVRAMNSNERDLLEERIKRTCRPAKGADSTDTGTTSASTAGSASTNAAGDNRLSTKSAKGHRDSSANRQSAAPLAANPAPAPVDINPLLREDITHRLINLDKEIEELNQPLERITLRYNGRPNQSVNSNDAIRAVINDINDSDMEKSIVAMAQIDEVIRNEDVYCQLKAHMDKLINSITMQMKATLSKLSDDRYNESEVTDMFRGMLATLVSVFNVGELARELSRNGLTELMRLLLQLVLNDQLVSLAEGATIIRGINVLSVRILESSNQTLMLSALIRMMSDCLKHGDLSSKYLYLIYKCIWSMTKNLVNTINTIELPVIIKDIHMFFTDFPAARWEASNKDVPLRTMKTLVHSLINTKRGGILEVLYQIPQAPGKELDQYVRKSYSKLNIPIPAVLPTAPESLEIQDIGDGFASDRTSMHPVATGNAKRPYLEELKQIFRKIGKPVENDQGFNDLYDFKMKYPYVDLDRYLCQTSAYFQKTIEAGLQDIASKRGSLFTATAGGTNKQSNNSGVPVTPPQPVGLDAWANCSMDPDTLLRRLNVLRQSVGLADIAKRSTDAVHAAAPAVSGHSNLNAITEMESSFMAKLDPSGDGPEDSSTDNNAKQALAPTNSNLGPPKMSSSELAGYKQRIEAVKRSKKP